MLTMKQAETIRRRMNDSEIIVGADVLGHCHVYSWVHVVSQLTTT